MSQSILIVCESRFFYTLPDRIQPLLWNFRKSNIGAVQVINTVLCFLAGRDFPYFGISRPIYIAPAGLSVRRTAFDISTLPPSIAALSDVFTASSPYKASLLTPYWPLMIWKLKLWLIIWTNWTTNHKKIDYIAENSPGGGGTKWCRTLFTQW